MLNKKCTEEDMVDILQDEYKGLTFTAIEQLMNKYPNDADFGRIVRWWIRSVNEM